MKKEKELKMRIFSFDEYHRDIYGIKAEKLLEMGIKGVLLDIDNTLVTYDDPEPTESVLSWFNSLVEKGIKIAFISNNSKERVELFNKDLGYYAEGDAKKPSVKGYYRAMEKMGIKKSECAVIGDQVFTDMWAANRAGMYGILVDPIKDKKTLFFRAKRLLEKPIVAKYKKEHGIT